MPDTTETRGVEIVRRLRAEGHDAFAKQYSLGMWKLCDDAADQIERLSRELLEAKKALKLAKEYVEAERECLLHSACRLDAAGDPIVSTIDPYCIDMLARDDATLQAICSVLSPKKDSETEVSRERETG